VRNGQTVWPDEFWVTDQYAFDLATKTFPNQPVKLKQNCYVDTQLQKIRSVHKASPLELLYILEPMRSDWGRDEQGEFQALDYFLENLPSLGLPSSTLISLRPHPSDAVGKYHDWIEARPRYNLQLDVNPDLAQSLGRASWVAGCSSFALVLALMAGRKTFCTLPPWAPECPLPHSGLIHIKQELRKV
jgi:hypothetical protein